MNQADLLREVESFLSETGMGPTYFGRRACRNTEFVRRLRERGADRVGTKTAETVLSFIDEQRRARGLQ